MTVLKWHDISTGLYGRHVLRCGEEDKNYAIVQRTSHGNTIYWDLYVVADCKAKGVQYVKPDPHDKRCMFVGNKRVCCPAAFTGFSDKHAAYKTLKEAKTAALKLLYSMGVCGYYPACDGYAPNASLGNALKT